MGLGLITMSLLALSQLFTAFIVPYYAFQHSRGKTSPFWIFIGNNVWPVVLYHIMAVFWVLLHSLLLIIPGIYKCNRFTFLTETVFFDEGCKSGGKSALKAAHNSTLGYFWFILFFNIFLLIAGMPLEFLLSKALSILPAFMKNALVIVIKFYFACFLLLFKTQIYFAIKQARKEELSS